MILGAVVVARVGIEDGLIYQVTCYNIILVICFEGINKIERM